ncbi:hypothetical protein A3C60_00355 [Candidatus Nomurabacteria bacterium RIFCSPHIGHO2_02_FULL_37_45]|uniref:AtpZ/AtpI family protein n=1 Tax=Candidatus Nomurabacteria bacterium RIFCSPHIGHO2_12_FULL_37_29 TaxID=1801759 RepID=A0A1F6WC52_9BACT|nr:MAG: hypothetical protein A3C60_00355 [Candidatus Nomurabacteria bacterium RIFCSPHIGHO2_02_FULL_37_45]OGI79469.1 MAG: hypothetical protein A3F19_00655 [Candidatus Nomurabacteria bacterium RIFCSPHIGHO2_12_FULL_37_29]OGI85206.1 MAG: hypothetical protein A3A92_00390 [Candidatus Nomurabacteria bacterium RIFCSPLOWO2_01_FULL_37_49]
MVESKENLNSNSPWWKPAIQIFSEISTWIAVPIILAMIGGQELDKHYGTKPIFLLAFAGVAFLVSTYGIVKSVRGYAAKIRREEKK